MEAEEGEVVGVVLAVAGRRGLQEACAPFRGAEREGEDVPAFGLLLHEVRLHPLVPAGAYVVEDGGAGVGGDEGLPRDAGGANGYGLREERVGGVEELLAADDLEVLGSSGHAPPAEARGEGAERLWCRESARPAQRARVTLVRLGHLAEARRFAVYPPLREAFGEARGVEGRPIVERAERFFVPLEDHRNRAIFFLLRLFFGQLCVLPGALGQPTTGGFGLPQRRTARRVCGGRFLSYTVSVGSDEDPTRDRGPR